MTDIRKEVGVKLKMQTTDFNGLEIESVASIADVKPFKDNCRHRAQKEHLIDWLVGCLIDKGIIAVCS